MRVLGGGSGKDWGARNERETHDYSCWGGAGGIEWGGAGGIEWGERKKGRVKTKHGGGKQETERGGLWEGERAMGRERQDGEKERARVFAPTQALDSEVYTSCVCSLAGLTFGLTFGIVQDPLRLTFGIVQDPLRARFDIFVSQRIST